jgi:hypothetical protein
MDINVALSYYATPVQRQETDKYEAKIMTMFLIALVPIDVVLRSEFYGGVNILFGLSVNRQETPLAFRSAFVNMDDVKSKATARKK